MKRQILFVITLFLIEINLILSQKIDTIFTTTDNYPLDEPLIGEDSCEFDKDEEELRDMCVIKIIILYDTLIRLPLKSECMKEWYGKTCSLSGLYEAYIKRDFCNVKLKKLKIVMEKNQIMNKNYFSLSEIEDCLLREKNLEDILTKHVFFKCECKSAKDKPYRVLFMKSFKIRFY